ncbi:unnamed protein product [Parnassius mnemosyne]|uniref:Hexosyltransferase n=1 Tax=Parnassius mnemosyne TaxID=213953 RepID=A0AAV1L5V4_9NEOP
MWTSSIHSAVCGAPIVLVHKMVRRKLFLLIALLLVSFLSVLPSSWWLANVVSHTLLPSPPPSQDLRQFLRNRNLQSYLNNIQLLAEPTPSDCESQSIIPMIILVSSRPHHFEQRDAIRNTWAKKQITYFIMGVQQSSRNFIMEGIYIEAEKLRDIIVYDFIDSYQNLTLKTALMLQWTLDKCSQVNFLFKTDDDVFVNPWTLKTVAREHPHAQLLGYKINKSRLHRDVYYKHYMPRWLQRDDIIQEYLSGTGYLINGGYLRKILNAAYKVPLVNIEDVYISYLVAKKTLNLTLTHDSRLSPKKPWIPLRCIYWNLATIHSVRPSEITSIWSSVKLVAKQYRRNKNVCNIYNFFNRDIFLY